MSARMPAGASLMAVRYDLTVTYSPAESIVVWPMLSAETVRTLAEGSAPTIGGWTWHLTYGDDACHAATDRAEADTFARHNL